ncbi:box C/D snoRNA protein 1 [Microcaecilia unicolor]|uniref:Box C/D snoRNA protein 1 n=1 Tax=Microcaecilia unicolor TaxID=1415580 RepID=A0A6P7Y7Z8_9AMPH|nr:box C/D snoRNA protein 1 [Microcaecilia unicolor]
MEAERERHEENCVLSPGTKSELCKDSDCWSEEEGAVVLKRKMSLHSCETCGSEEARYRCPRCMKYSCSLPCVKKHKAAIQCSGVRDKAAFVSLSKFDEMTLLSDYRFLEDVARTYDCAARDVLLHKPTSYKFLGFMKNRARKCKIDLKILPVGFKKRRENSTFFCQKQKRFCWHLKLIFPQSHAEYMAKRVPDDRTLHEILKKYISLKESDPVIRQRLKAYILSQSGVSVFMKAESEKHSSARWYELDSEKSLFENLKNKTIVEYPTLHVVLKDFRNDFLGVGQETSDTRSPALPALSQNEEEEIEEGEIRDST